MGSREDHLLRLVSDSHNRTILSILSDISRPVPIAELTERFLVHESTMFGPSEYEQAHLFLHHERLPKLDAAGVIDYDFEEGVVSRESYPSVDAEWFPFEEIDEILSQFGPKRQPDEDAVGLIEGRERVYEYARRLADEAETELFLIYVSDDLLDDDCLPQARNAIDRGVDFRVGSQNPDVRDFFRTRLPGATIWEPQLDWMNEASTYPRIDRLILTDRETVIFGLLEEPNADGESTERALVGKGANNPLVVLVRELLGPRLDHLDHQSEDFRSKFRF